MHRTSMGKLTGFVHLHVHTEHSPLDGLSGLGAALDKVAAAGDHALAITDHGTMGGAWKFANIARKKGVKPIIGIEAYLAIAEDWHDEPNRHERGEQKIDRDDDTSSDPDAEDGDKDDAKGQKVKRNMHITLLAKNAKGFENLTRMVNESNNSFYGKPLMDFQLMKQFGDGIIALTGCLGGPVLGPMSRGAVDEAELNLDRIIDAVGKENVYVEIMEHGIEAESKALPAMAALAARKGLPLVATNDSHYVNAEDESVHEAWLAVQSGKTLTDPKRFKFHGAGFHLRTETEMRELRGEEWWQTAVSNTLVVAERCDDVVPLPEIRVPKFQVPDTYKSSRSFLVAKVQKNAELIYGTPLPKVVKERLSTELKIIHDMGFVDYFLIVDDVISWARANGIRVGPGRGSAAGSLISYCLGIVRVDPLENNLLFERFLEPGRAGMPDIDVDFEKGRRHEVLQYLAERWGADRVARIGSFSASKTRRAIRDAAKLLGGSNIGDALSKAVPIGDGGQPYRFDQLFDLTDQAGQRFRDLLTSFGDAGNAIVDLAKGFADTVNGESIHACGTLIADIDLNGLIPMRYDRSKSGSSGLRTVTQWDGKDIDDFGLLKLDVLGLRNLDVISKAAQFILETTGEVVDPDALPHPNTKGDRRVQNTWELLRSGRTAGVFQMESPGMSRLSQQVKPDCLADLSAVVALYRPGPMSANMHIMYADRKSGEQKVDYGMFTSDLAEQEAIATVLGETYGVFVYQEQLMRLGTVVAGFDAVLRSKLRKAVGKKIPALMAQVGEALIEGAPNEVRDPITNEITSPVFARATAAALYDYMKGSADYLFNASHSFAYAQLAYVTAFMKANWPAQYGAAILAVTSDAEKRQAALRALHEEGIEVLAPDVNLSKSETFPIGDRTIILGLSEIKGVGQSGSAIADFREQHRTKFTSANDLINRVLADDGKSLVDVGTIEGLIESGAMDQFGPRLGQMRVARVAKLHDFVVPGDEWGILERSSRQRARLGVIMGIHPLQALGSQVRNWQTPTLEEYKGNKHGQVAVPLSKIPEIDNASILTIAVLAEWNERGYSKGQMANFTIESSKESIRGVLWDQTLKSLRADGGIPAVGTIVAVSGRVQVRTRDVEDEEGLIIDTVVTKEIMGSKLWLVPVDDGATSVIPTRTVIPFRDHLHIISNPEPEEADEADAADAAEADDAEEQPAEEPSVVSELDVARERTGRAVPVIGRVNDGMTTEVWSSHRNGKELIRRIRASHGVMFDPLIRGSSHGVSKVIEGRKTIALFVTLPGEYEHATLPKTWVLDGDDLPHWSAFLEDEVVPSDLRPDVGLESESTPEVAPVVAPVEAYLDEIGAFS
jgi:DNA polymerase-3 subunit alpha